MNGPTAADLARVLNDRSEAVAAALGLSPVRKAGDKLVYEAPWDAGRDGKLWLRVSGSRAGQWIDFRDPDRLKGDVFDLIACVLGGGMKDRKAAWRWAMDFLGFGQRHGESEEARAARQERLAAAVAGARVASEKRERQAKAQLARDRQRCHGLWLAGQPLGHESAGPQAVRAYLAARGIDVNVLADPARPGGGRLPGAIRAMAACDHHCDETGEVTSWPAMLTLMTLADGKPGCLHRTWIDPARPGQKAPVSAPRKMWPSSTGAASRLARGASGKPATSAAPSSDLVLVCEGVEDGLSLSLICPEARVEAAGSLPGLLSWQVPDSAREVRVCADRDWNNDKARALLDRAVAGIAGRAPAGCKIGVVWPPEPFQDWNDALRGGVL
jgi:hypothetical protein